MAIGVQLAQEPSKGVGGDCLGDIGDDLGGDQPRGGQRGLSRSVSEHQLILLCIRFCDDKFSRHCTAHNLDTLTDTLTKQCTEPLRSLLLTLWLETLETSKTPKSSKCSKTS